MTSKVERATRILLAGLAVSAAFAMSACSKKSGSVNVNAKSEAPPPPAPAPTPTPTPTPHPSGAKKSGELDNQSSRSAQDSAAGAGAQSDKDKSKVGDNKDQAVLTQVLFDPTGMNVDQVFAASARQGSAPLGSISNLTNPGGVNLFFSGAGQDDLRLQLKRMIDTDESPIRKRANMDFARSFTLMSYDYEPSTKSAVLIVQYERDGRNVSVRFAGTFDSDGVMRDEHRGPLGVKVKAKATCMDYPKGCGTVHLRVRESRKEFETKDGRTVPRMSRTAHVIARQTNAELGVDAISPVDAYNPMYAQMHRIFTNTAVRNGAHERVKSLRMKTTETIYGASMFTVTMLLGNGPREEILGFRGPLVKPRRSTQLSVPVQINEPRVFSPVPVDPPTVVSNWISDVRLIRNDGRGNIQLEVTVPASYPYARNDRFRIMFARKHVFVRALESAKAAAEDAIEIQSSDEPVPEMAEAGVQEVAAGGVPPAPPAAPAPQAQPAAAP